MPTLTVIVEQLLAPVPGGTGRVTAELTGALRAAAPPGWTLRTVSAFHRDLGAAVIEPGADGGTGAGRQELRPHRLPFGRRVLSELWSRGLPPWVGGDVVLATTPLFPPIRPPWQRRQRTMVIVHDAVPWTHPQTLSPRGTAWHRTMIGRALRRSVVITPSAAAAAALGTALGTAVGTLVDGEHRFEPVPWGVSSALAAPADAAERRARLQVPERRLVFVGTLEPRKGLDVLVAALAAMDPADRVPLVVVGPSGWGEVDPAGAARGAGLAEDAILPLGRLDDADLAAVVQGALALVAPSRSEGFGLPVLEAMTLQVPVVISDAAALTEVAGGAALVTPVGDSGALAEALTRITTDDELRRRMSVAGAERAKQFTWSKAADRVWQLVTESESESAAR